MAVAVKTNPGTPSAGSRGTPALVSLVGVLFLLACLAIVFKLVPSLWLTAWDSLGLGTAVFVSRALMLVVGLVVAVALLALGVKLLGPEPPPGVRAGVAVGFLGLLLVVLLARWASLWVEYYVYFYHSFTPQVGMGLCIAIAAALLIGGLYLFVKPDNQRRFVAVEAGGWFSATPYKSNQGQRVRRATILGILLIVGAGIYTLLSHNVLARGSENWTIDLPFTGRMALESYGDTASFLADLPLAQKNEVQITSRGSSSFEPKQLVTFASYKEEVEKALKGHAAAAAGDEPTAYLTALAKNVFDPAMRAVLANRGLPESLLRRLEAQYQPSTYENLGSLLPVFKRELTDANRLDENTAWVWDVPAALLVVDRYVLRDLNAKTDATQYVKITLPSDDPNSPFKEGDIVPLSKYNDEVERLEALRDRSLPQKGALTSAYGKTTYASVTLLPAVQYTVPLLLLAASLWLAWRVVNMPSFADFLIATEAELNKVSWTTQRRLVQDTVVVLVTVVVMAVFLFGMDYTWKVLLSWRPIGVLHIPKESGQQNKSAEHKRW